MVLSLGQGAHGRIFDEGLAQFLGATLNQHDAQKIVGNGLRQEGCAQSTEAEEFIHILLDVHSRKRQAFELGEGEQRVGAFDVNVKQGHAQLTKRIDVQSHDGVNAASEGFEEGAECLADKKDAHEGNHAKFGWDEIGTNRNQELPKKSIEDRQGRNLILGEWAGIRLGEVVDGLVHGGVNVYNLSSHGGSKLETLPM